MKFEELYTKTLQPINEEIEPVFETEVNLDLFPERGDSHGKEDYDSPLTVTIRYKLHMEYGRRGLKGIQYELVSVSPFSIERTKYDNDNYDNPQTDTIDIDLSNLKCVNSVELSNGQAIAQVIEIHLDGDYKPAYCKIEF